MRYSSFFVLLALMLCIFGMSYAQTTVTIGTGTSGYYDPFNAFYGFSRSVGLYTCAQIGQFGQITNLGWSVSSTCPTAIPYKIYVKATTATEFEQMTWLDFTTGATMVKQGTYSFSTSGWNTFALDTPFAYTGGNLIVGVETNIGGFGADTYPMFHYTYNTPNSHQQWSANNSEPTGDGTLEPWLPNLQIELSALAGDPVLSVNPAGWDFGRVMFNAASSKTFVIGNAGGGTITVNSLTPTSNGYFSVTSAPAFPLVLASGATATFTIQYAPTAVGNHSAIFTIADGRATTNVNVSGEGFDPTITSFPHLENFDGTWTGSPLAPETWTVINADNDGYTWRRGNSWITPTHSTPYAAYGSGNNNDWLITPPPQPQRHRCEAEMVGQGGKFQQSQLLQSLCIHHYTGGSFLYHRIG